MKIAIMGAGGHGVVVLDVLQRIGHTNLLFADKIKAGEQVLGVPVEDPTHLCWGDVDGCIIAIGNNKVREKLSLDWKQRYITAVHPNAIISSLAVELVEGTVVMAGVVINPRVRIGAHCIINTKSSIDHDCTIGDFVHISPGATLCGTVTVEEGAHIGAGATIIPGKKIGAWAVVGAGAVVVSDVPAGATVVGVPAKIIKQ
jgi:acetyltransferase EpsM